MEGGVTWLYDRHAGDGLTPCLVLIELPGCFNRKLGHTVGFIHMGQSMNGRHPPSKLLSLALCAVWLVEMMHGVSLEN